MQSKSCLVTHVWQCEADAEGEQWIALFNRVGPFNVRKVDENFQWLETYYNQDGKVETMVLPAEDEPSLTELFETQTDTYDFQIENNLGEPTERVRGFDLLTGEEVEIDGEPLLATVSRSETGRISSRSPGKIRSGSSQAARAVRASAAIGSPMREKSLVTILIRTRLSLTCVPPDQPC